MGRLYGEDQYVYNVHGLVHLANDASRFGVLDDYSAFVFESFLGTLKRLIRKPNFPLQQVMRRWLNGHEVSMKCLKRECRQCGVDAIQKFYLPVDQTEKPADHDGNTGVVYDEWKTTSHVITVKSKGVAGNLEKRTVKRLKG